MRRGGLLLALLLLRAAAAPAAPHISITHCSNTEQILRGLITYRSLGAFQSQSTDDASDRERCEMSHGGVIKTLGDGDNVLPRANAWLRDHFSATIVFKNVGDAPVEHFWVHVFNKDRQLLATLRPGEERVENTHVGHVFMFRRAGDKRVLGYAAVGFEGHPTPQHVLIPDDLVPMQDANVVAACDSADAASNTSGTRSERSSIIGARRGPRSRGCSPT